MEPIVITNIPYTSGILFQDLMALKELYPVMEITSVGKSIWGTAIPAVKLGMGERIVSYNAAHHGLEWITTPVLMKFLEEYLKALYDSTDPRSALARRIWLESTLYLIPMVNPDGVDIVTGAVLPGTQQYEEVEELNYTGEPLSQVWKANARGIDLNRNYPAAFELAKELWESQGILGPGPAYYGGEFPLSEPESIAMADFTEEIDPDMVIAFHTQGQEIYYRFMDDTTPEMTRIAEEFARLTGYTLADSPENASYAGYKDWFIQDFGRPGFTIEAGSGQNPLPISQFDSIYDDLEDLLWQAPLI